MKKTRVISISAILIALIAFLFVNLRDATGNIRLGKEIANGLETSVVYQVATEDDLAKNRDILEERLRVFGMDDADISEVDDMGIVVQYASTDSDELLRELITSQGNITVRDSQDNLLADGHDLFSSMSLRESKGNYYVYFKVKDQALMYSITSSLKSKTSGENVMVVWLDFEDGVTSYATDKNLDNPRFLAASTVTQTIKDEGTFYSPHDKETIKANIAVFNGGAYTVKAVENATINLESMHGSGFGDALKLGSLIAGALVLVGLIVRYRKAGLVASVSTALSVGYMAISFRYFDGVITLSSTVGFVASFAIGLFFIVSFYESMRDAMYSGRTPLNAYTAALEKCKYVHAFTFLTVFGFSLLYVFSNGAIRSFAITLMLGTILNYIFLIWLQKFIVGQLCDTTILGKRSSFGVSEKDVPNVELGEGRKKFSFVQKVNYVTRSKVVTALSVVLVLVSFIVMFMSFNSGNSILLRGQAFGGGYEVIEYGSDIDLNATVKALQDNGVEVIESQAGVINEQPIARYYVLGESKEQIANSTLELSNQFSSLKVDDVSASSTILDVATMFAFGIVVAFAIIFMTQKAWSGFVIFISTGLSALLSTGIMAMLPINNGATTFGTIALSAILTIAFSVFLSTKFKEAIVLLKRDKKTSNNDYKTMVNEVVQTNVLSILVPTSLILLFVLVLAGVCGFSALAYFSQMLIAVLIACVSAIFIFPYLWLQRNFEAKKDKPVSKKKENKKKPKKKEAEEMTVFGLNDY